jgi:hypothetical protein
MMIKGYLNTFAECSCNDCVGKFSRTYKHSALRLRTTMSIVGIALGLSVGAHAYWSSKLISNSIGFVLELLGINFEMEYGSGSVHNLINVDLHYSETCTTNIHFLEKDF